MTSNTPPVVSVVIAFLDPPIPFLREAVASVMAQTFRDWELLLVDDGSSGTATGVARQYARNDARIRYLEFAGHENRGLAAARNLGWQEARGTYVATLDADDVWDSEKLERQTAILGDWPDAVMVYSKTRYWYGWTGLPEDTRRDFVQPHALYRRHGSPDALDNRLIRPPDLLTMYLRDEAAVPSASNIMVRRSTLRDLGGFEERFQLYEDQTLYAKVCAAAAVYLSGDCWDSYRQHPDSMCAAARGTNRDAVSRRAYLEWLAAYLGRTGERDATLWRELRRKRWMARQGQIGRVMGAVTKRLRPLVATPLPLR